VPRHSENESDRWENSVESVFLAYSVCIHTHSGPGNDQGVREGLRKRNRRSRRRNMFTDRSEPDRRPGDRKPGRGSEHESNGDRPAVRAGRSVFSVQDYIFLAQTIYRTSRHKVCRPVPGGRGRRAQGLHVTICSGLHTENMA